MTVESTILRGRPGQTKTWHVLRKLIHVREQMIGGRLMPIDFSRDSSAFESFAPTSFHLTSIIIRLISHDKMDVGAYSLQRDLCTKCSEIGGRCIFFLKI